MRFTDDRRSKALSRRLIVAAVVFTVAFSLVSAGEKPRLDLRSGHLEVVSSGADGSQRRHVLRENVDEASLIATGGLASPDSRFITWQEGSEKNWTAFSRDGGETWSTPRRFQRSLEFREVSVSHRDAMPVFDRRLSAGPEQRVFFIQLKTISLPEWRAQLTRTGVELLSYFPHHAYLARVPIGRTREIAALDVVDRVEPYHPAYRIERSLRAWVLEPEEEVATPERRVISLRTFESGREGKAAVDSFLRASGATILRNGASSQGLRAKVTREEVRKLAARDDVMWLEPWVPSSYSLDLVRESSGAAAVEIFPGYCGTGVVGEVLDSGIFDCPENPERSDCIDHFEGVRYHRAYTPEETDPALNVGTLVKPVPDNFDGIPLGEYPPKPWEGEEGQHGTPVYGILFNPQWPKGLLHCGTGIVANSAWLEGGDDRYQPTEPADWEPVDRYDHTAELKDHPYYASFQTNSWGTGDHTINYSDVSAGLDKIAFELDIAITQAMGNDGANIGHEQAWSKNVISVGGIYHRDTPETSDDAWCHQEDCDPLPEDECVANPWCRWCRCEPDDENCTCTPGEECQRVSCASIGPASDERIKPDLHYWYDRINTTHWDLQQGYADPTYGVSYANFGGTSAATPAVAGVLGLIVEMWADNVWGTNPQGDTVFERQPHASTIKALLINSAIQYPFDGPEHDLARTHQGWGRPSAAKALDRAARSFVVDESIPLDSLSDDVTFQFAVALYEPELKITLVYPDPAAFPGAGAALVNDLDLVVTSPSGLTYYGNHGLDEGVVSTAGGDPDTINNVENVFLQAPESGLWSITVRASNIVDDGYLATPDWDDAVFALVATGVLPPEMMHIQEFTMDTETRGPRVRGLGTVKVVDQDGEAVEGAQLIGQWTGPILEKQSAVTDANGIAEFATDYVRASTYCFNLDITKVSLDGRTYDPSENVATSGQEGNACP